MSERTWRSRIEGTLLRRGDTGYETARTRALWSELKPDQYPDVIVRAAGERDVQTSTSQGSASGRSMPTRRRRSCSQASSEADS
ncbi:hypothetical protein ACH4ND_16990 [Streptomyces sp. NPDC017179]|uniref:hypothetical protein n=1 Tax=Streptomyces sp. NPDC017179 TaxID=3364979 RepID=UPI0037B271B4